MSFPWAYHISFLVWGWCRSTLSHTQISQAVKTMAAPPAAGAPDHWVLSVQCDCWGLGHWDLGAEDLTGQSSLHPFLWDTTGMSLSTMSGAPVWTLGAPLELQKLWSCQQQLPSKDSSRALRAWGPHQEPSPGDPVA